MPVFIQAKGYPDSTNGLILGTGSLGLLVSLLLMGRWIDRSDPRRFIASGAFIWAATSALLAAWPSIWIIVFCRFMQGFAYALFYTAALVYATRSTPEDLRGTVVGMIEAVGALAIAATPFAAFPLSLVWGYATAFWIAAALSGMACLSVFLLARCAPPTPADLLDRHFQLLTKRALFPGLVAVCMFSVAIAYISFAPLIARQVGAVSISLYMGLRAFGTVPTRFFSGSIADTKGPEWVVVPGFVAALLAMLLLPWLQQLPWLYLVPALFGLGMGSASPALTAWMLKDTPHQEHAVAINTFTIMTEGSGFFSTWLVGGFLQSGRLTGFLSFAGLLGVGLLLFLAKRHNRFEMEENRNQAGNSA